MSNKDFENMILKERSFYENFDEKNYGKYCYLLGHSITAYRYIDTWENEFLPYLLSLKNGTGKISDWNAFHWHGIICFRYDHVMILDESIHQVGRRLPGLTNDKGDNILNEDGEWLLDTLFIENNYNEYVKISLESYIDYFRQWIRILQSENSKL